jgi:hypothetical protein
MGITDEQLVYCRLEWLTYGQTKFVNITNAVGVVLGLAGVLTLLVVRAKMHSASRCYAGNYRSVKPMCMAPHDTVC